MEIVEFCMTLSFTLKNNSQAKRKTAKLLSQLDLGQQICPILKCVKFLGKREKKETKNAHKNHHQKNHQPKKPHIKKNQQKIQNK